MENTFFLALLSLVFAVAIWTVPGTRNMYFDVYRAGLVESRRTIATAMTGAVIALLVLALGNRTPTAFEAFAVMALCASWATLGYYWALACLHGIDSRMAELQMQQWERAQVSPAARLKDEPKLQVYLDRTYGKGKVSAKEMLAREQTRVIH